MAVAQEQIGTKRDFVPAVVACYRPSVSHHAWAKGLLQALSCSRAEPRASTPSGENGFCAGLLVARESVSTWVNEVVAFADLPPVPAMPRRELEPSVVDFLRDPPGTLVMMGSLEERLPASWARWLEQCRSERGLTDLCALFGKPSADTAFVLWLGVEPTQRFDGALRDALQRVRIHLEAALRLRFASRECAVAAVSLDGRVDYLDLQLGGLPSSEALTRRVQAIEQAKAGSSAGQADGLATWPPLVDGHWSLVEQEGARGERYYLALLNPPTVRPHRALRAREAAVIDLSARGLSNKHVAYALGISSSNVSSVLSAVARRLGFATRSELIRVAVDGFGGSFAAPGERLTSAEASVLELVQRGLSNQAIAKARGTSERTVANQVASLLRKTGASTRRALLVMERNGPATGTHVRVTDEDPAVLAHGATPPARARRG